MRHFVVMLRHLFGFGFLLVSEQVTLQSVRFLLCFQMVHFVGMPVMCSDMLQNSMHEASKPVTGILLFKGCVVDFDKPNHRFALQIW